MARTRDSGDELTLLGDDNKRRNSEFETELGEAERVREVPARMSTLPDRELYRSTLVADVGRLSAYVADYDAMATHLLELVGRTAACDVCGLALVRGEERRLAVDVQQQVGGDLLDQFAERVVQACAASAGSVLNREEFSESVLSGETTARAAGEKIRSFEALPLRIGNETFGVLAAARARGGFPEAEAEALEIIADLAAIAVDDAARREALKRSGARIVTLHKTARALQTCRAEDAVGTLTIEAAESMFPLKACALRAPNDQGLGAGAVRGEGGVPGEVDGGGALEATPERGGPAVDMPMAELGTFHCASSEPGGFGDEDTRLMELLLVCAAEAIRRIRLRDELRRQAIRDPLTGVYNRRYFMETIGRELERSKRGGGSVGFLMTDVSGLKHINDEHGHQTGDRVLVEVAALLQAQVRASEMVIRYGGDEFLVVLSQVVGDVGDVKRRIEAAAARWSETSGLFDFPVGLSIGCAQLEPAGSESVEEALARADRRMYEDKARQAPQDRSDSRVTRH